MIVYSAIRHISLAGDSGSNPALICRRRRADDRQERFRVTVRRAREAQQAKARGERRGATSCRP
jgi:hypothetical protein